MCSGWFTIDSGDNAVEEEIMGGADNDTENDTGEQSETLAARSTSGLHKDNYDDSGESRRSRLLTNIYDATEEVKIDEE